MMAKNRACPRCKEMGHDSMDDHLFQMSDNKRWYCGHEDYHKDGKAYIEGDEGDYEGIGDISSLIDDSCVSGDTKEVPRSTLSVLPSSRSGAAEPVAEGRVHYVPPPRGSTTGNIKATYRGITPSTYIKFGVRGVYTPGGQCWEMENDLYESNSNALITQKIRQLPKTFTCRSKTGKGRLLQLFGQSVFSDAKKLLIVEGELDACSAWQMFQGGKYTKGVAVMSLPLGANLKAVSDNLKHLKANFKEFTFCFDSDKAGQAASKLMANLMPSSKHMSISEKDANDMLTKGKEAEFISTFFNADVYRPEMIVRVDDIIADVLKKPTIGTDWPWPSLTRATYGRRGGEGMFVGAGVKCGKCFGINTEIRMHNGLLKSVQDIKVGDEVMGLDGLPNPVMHTHQGVDTMYRVSQNKALDYTVNSQHLICLKETVTGRERTVAAGAYKGLKDWRGYKNATGLPGRSPVLTGISVDNVGTGQYYGFTLGGEDKRCLLSDYTVVHNSEFINQVIAFDCSQGHKIAVIKFEELPAMTCKRVAGKLDGVFYHRPGATYSDTVLEGTVRSFSDELILHRAFGTANWDTIKDFIRYAAMSGCKTIVIDPITRITNGLSSSDTETELRRFSDELSCMAQDMDFFYIVTCHLKAPQSGLSHERGGRVETYQFRGSRAMSESCYYFLGIQRNKDPDLSEDERNTSTFVLLEDRAFGNVCKYPVFYDKITQSYLEPTVNLAF